MDKEYISLFDVCGYKVMVTKDGDDGYIPNVEYIGKDNNSNVFDDDCEAQEQAVLDGVELLTGFISIQDNVYMDTIDNRQKLQNYFEENPMYKIVDMETMSKLISESLDVYMYLNPGSGLNEFSKFLEVSTIHLSRIMRMLIPITSSDVVNNLVNKTDINEKELFGCVEPISERFI